MSGGTRGDNKEAGGHALPPHVAPGRGFGDPALQELSRADVPLIGTATARLAAKSDERSRPQRGMSASSVHTFTSGRSAGERDDRFSYAAIRPVDPIDAKVACDARETEAVVAGPGGCLHQPGTIGRSSDRHVRHKAGGQRLAKLPIQTLVDQSNLFVPRGRDEKEVLLVHYCSAACSIASRARARVIAVGYTKVI